MLTASPRATQQITAADAKIPALVLAIKHGDPNALNELCVIIETVDAAKTYSDPDKYTVRKWTAQTGAKINQLARKVSAPHATIPPVEAIADARRRNDPQAARAAGRALAHEPAESVAATLAGLLASITQSNPDAVAWIALFVVGWTESELSAENALAWQIAAALDAASLGKMADTVRKSTRKDAILEAANKGAADALLSSEARDSAAILALIEDAALRETYTAKQLARTVENARAAIGARLVRPLSTGRGTWQPTLEMIAASNGERCYIDRMDSEYGLAHALKGCPSWQMLRQIMASECARDYATHSPSAAHSAVVEILETAAKNPEAKFVLKALAEKHKPPESTGYAERHTAVITENIKNTLAGFGAYIENRRLVWI